MQARPDSNSSDAISNFAGKVGWWRLGESSGTTAGDEQGTQNGTYVGTVTLGQPGLPSDMPDTAVTLGADGYVDIPHHASHALSACSIFISFRTPSNLERSFAIWSKDALGNNPDDISFFYFQPANELRVNRWNGSAVVRCQAAGVLAPDTDYRAVISLGPTNGMRMFLASGGTVALRGSNADTGALASNTNPIFVGAGGYGASPSSPTDFLASRIGEHLILDHEASDAEIEAYCQAELAEEGTYEPAVIALSPAIYLKLTETSGSTFADSSGAGRSGSLKGTGATLGAMALAPNVGGSNTAINLGSSAWIEVPHAATDTALTTSYASPWDGDQTDNRFIADCLVCCYFRLNALPGGGDKAVIFAKSNTTSPGPAASYDGSFEAYVDSDRECHVEVRSFRGRPCRIRTPKGAVSANKTYHLAVQLGYDGVAAWLDGAKFEDGYGNLMHVFGLAAETWGWTGSTWAYGVRANTNAWTIGKAAWGGQANIIVDEFAVFNRAPSGSMTQADVNILSQQGSTPAALPHFIWGQEEVTISSGIQAAITACNAAGGGTVLINPGNYVSEGTVTLKSNVRIKANGGTVTIREIRTSNEPRDKDLGPGSGGFAAGARTISVTNDRSSGDVAVVKGKQASGTPPDSPVRHDGRWNTLSQSNDKEAVDAQTFEIEDSDGSSLTFVGPGHIYDLPVGHRDSIEVFTPTSWIAIEGDIRASSAGNACLIQQTKHGRFIGVTLTNTNTESDRHALRIEWNSIYCQVRNLELIQATIPSKGFDNDGLASWHGATHIVWKDCNAHEGRHGADVSGSSNFGIVTHCEYHHCFWENRNSTGASGAAAAYGIHGPSAYCLWWNCDSDWGGPGTCGWRHDSKWSVCGDAARVGGAIGFNDGAKECVWKHIRILRPDRWFVCGEGVVSVDNCHFENITRSAAPSTSNIHVDEGTPNAIEYGTGSLVNTYANVDEPHEDWVEV